MTTRILNIPTRETCTLASLTADPCDWAYDGGAPIVSFVCGGASMFLYFEARTACLYTEATAEDEMGNATPTEVSRFRAGGADATDDALFAASVACFALAGIGLTTGDLAALRRAIAHIGPEVRS